MLHQALARMRIGALALCAVAAPTVALAQADWPQRNVQFVLPFGPGSATDIAARLIGERVQSKWGKSVVIENRAGGDGLIAIRSFLSAKDDHVLLYASSASFIAHPYTLPEKTPYDLQKDFAPIARVADTLLAIAAPASLNVNTLDEWVKLARSQPGKMNGAGAPGLPDLAMQAFFKSNDLQATRVPYRDIVQGASDLAEGRIQFIVTSYAIALPHIQSGRAKLLAVGSRERATVTPTTPTAAEAGHPILTIETTSGLYGPAGMPKALRERIAADVIEAVKGETVNARLVSTGQIPAPQGPDALAAALKQQEESAAAVAKVLGITANR